MYMLSAWLEALFRASLRMVFSCCRRDNWAAGPFSSWSCRLWIYNRNEARTHYRNDKDKTKFTDSKKKKKDFKWQPLEDTKYLKGSKINKPNEIITFPWRFHTFKLYTRFFGCTFAKNCESFSWINHAVGISWKLYGTDVQINSAWKEEVCLHWTNPWALTLLLSFWVWSVCSS